jgi:dienelactone hydrolase
MHHKWITYTHDGLEMQGYLAFVEPSSLKRPAVLVAHAWKGQDDFAREKAQMLAHLGYIGFAIDLYGKGLLASTNEEADALMTPLFLNRPLLQGRLVAAYEALCLQDLVDKEKIGGIGFCFGGLAILELLRCGAPILGTISFHAVLSNKRNEKEALLCPIAKNIQGKCLILHGHDDPLVSQEDIMNVQKELTDAGVDWQMHIYGHTSHAFTVPQASDKAHGLLYNPLSERRAMESLKQFFKEIF